MKKAIMGVLLGVAILCYPVTAHANSMSYIPTQEETNIPTDIYQYCEIVGNEFNICPELLMALAERESRCNPTATNGSCKGLMQVSVNFHKDRFIDMGWSPEDWDDPYRNVYVAGDYLHDLFEDYEDAATVLMVYHGESNAVSKGQSGNISKYAQGILQRSYELERVHGK
ncbi:transglycosylase SLT domain-containing protein [Butyrivibrio sp. AE2032]|uniref:transglycosylase SLT domain-containing protein n=1 Tax=Butyrivibrio sp. AE2032 TaxID=1458463 RepID=UPI00055705F7|nr:transglycosylase SLT domain-containing protein [Butyrivibrio sp. AE2032]